MEFSTFVPSNDLILVRRVVEDNSKMGEDGTFIVPEKFRQQSDRAIVVSVSPLVCIPLFPGDRIMFGKYNAEDVVVNGEKLLLIRENDVRGVERAKLIV